MMGALYFTVSPATVSSICTMWPPTTASTTTSVMLPYYWPKVTCSVSLSDILQQVTSLPPADFNQFIFQVICHRWGKRDGDALDNARAELEKTGHVLPSGTYHLPDGAILTIAYNSNYEINDREARVIYKSNRHREFNEFVNVSDILDQFMHYAANLGLSREQFLAVPIQNFLMWLIIEAARKDGELVPDKDVKQLELALGDQRTAKVS